MLHIQTWIRGKSIFYAQFAGEIDGSKICKFDNNEISLLFFTVIRCWHGPVSTGSTRCQLTFYQRLSAIIIYCFIHTLLPRTTHARSRLKQSALSIDIPRYLYIMYKTTSNTLNTYLYCCKSLPRTVNQILYLPSSLRSKNSLHGLRWGGFWIATPLPATQTPPRHDITSFTTCTASYSAPRMHEAGVEMPKRTRKPSLKVRENLQFQEEK